MKVQCKCGKIFNTCPSRIKLGKGKYCSKKCGYKFKGRRSGLTYIIKKVNSAWFTKGFTPWNKNKNGLMPIPWNKNTKGLTSANITSYKKGQFKNEKHLKWKGNNVGYYALHSWLYRNIGRPVICKHCGGFSNLEWANKSHEYKRIKSDWISLCHICHIKYDRGDSWGKATQQYPELRKGY